ncbi:unnamed protein product, partial [Rotaria magnacalcarata]
RASLHDAIDSHFLLFKLKRKHFLIAMGPSLVIIKPPTIIIVLGAIKQTAGKNTPC